MRSEVSTILLTALVAVINASSSFLLQDGKEYVFETEVSANSGTMDYVAHTSGFNYKYHTRIQIHGNKANIQISDLTFSEFNGAHEASGHAFDETKHTPIADAVPAFSVEVDEHGLFSHLTYPGELPIFEKNIMKAWAQLLQMNKDKIDNHDVGFKSHEKLLNGDCDVTYTVSPHKIIKTVAVNSDCNHRVYRFLHSFDIHDCSYDAKGKTKSPEGLHTTSTTVYKVDKKDDHFDVKAIVSTGTIMSQMYKEEGASYYIFTNLTAILKEVKDSGHDITASGETTDSLQFEWSDTKYKWNVDRDLKAAEPFFSSGKYFEEDMATLKNGLMKGLLFQLKLMKDLSHSKDAIEKAHKYGLHTLLPSMYAMDYDTLKSITFELLADKSKDGVTKSNIFNEFLGMTGTTASSLVIRDLVLENKFDNARDALRVLTSVPFHIRRPNTQLLNEFEQLLNFEAESILKDHIPLIFGHLVRVTCERAGHGNFHSPELKECFKTVPQKYINQHIDVVKSSSDHEAKNLAIHALANIRYGGIAEKLKPIIYGETDVKCPRLRHSAIWAASHENLAHHNGVAYYLPIFAHSHYPTEMRIAAIINVFQSHPSSADINAIVAVLYTEEDYEVLNFVFTLFETYASSITECFKETGHLARYYLKYMKQWSHFEAQYGFGISKTYRREFEQKKYGYGGSLTYDIIGSHKSTTPLIVYISLDRSIHKTAVTPMVAVVLRIEGLAKALIKKMKKIDHSVWKLDELEKVLSTDMDIRAIPDQSVKVEINLMVKGQIVFYRQYDENSVKPGGKITDFIETLKGLQDTYTVNHQRAYQLGSALYEQPTPLGIPMAYISSATSLMSLEATVKKGNHRGLLFRDVDYDIHQYTQASQIMMIRNPPRKKTYGVTQSKVYYVHFPRKFVVGVNIVKKELKLNIHRPTTDNPGVMLMHSQSEVKVRADTLYGETDITNHCPTCKSRVVVSAGPEAAKTRVIIDRENQVMGRWMHGEFFDCEYGMDRGRTIYHGLRAMLPYNKNPKTLYTSVVLGLAQIRAFFLHYPRVEKCGILLKRSQSKNNPVREVEVSVRANTEPNGERLFFRGRKVYIKMLIKAKGEPADRLYKVNFAYEYTPGYLKNNVKLQILRAGVPNLMDDFSLCFNYENEYPNFSEEFMSYDKSHQLEVNGKARLRYGHVTDCGNAEGEMKMTFKHSTTEKARHDLESKYYYKHCMEQKRSGEFSNRDDQYPPTEDCYLTVWDATSARKYTWDLHFVKQTDRMNAIISQFQSVVSVGLLPYWDVDPEVVTPSTTDPHMTIKAEFKDEDKSLDMYLETSQGGHNFNNIPLRLDWYNRFRNLKFTKTLKRLVQSRIINPCMVTNQHVQTMDNVTYEYTPTSCWTLASGHCSDEPTYAVFTKKSTGLPLAVKAFFGGHLVEFKPAGPKEVHVTVNGEPLDIADKERVHTEKGQEIFKINKWGSTYNIYSFLKVWIIYDGHYVQITAAPSVKGQHCGLCGNYNRNLKDEFTGKHHELLKSASEMVEDYKWKC